MHATYVMNAKSMHAVLNNAGLM